MGAPTVLVYHVIYKLWHHICVDLDAIHYGLTVTLLLRVHPHIRMCCWFESVHCAYHTQFEDKQSLKPVTRLVMQR